MVLQTNSIANQIINKDLSKNDISSIVNALKFKGYIITAVLPTSPESETFAHFLECFWSYDTSPYVAEKHIVGQTIHRRYTKIMLGRVKTYWIPTLGSKPLGAITKNDIKNTIYKLATLPQSIPTRKKNADGSYVLKKVMLSSETVNQVTRAVTCPLKWAFHNGLIKTDCFSGIMYCHVTPKKRRILKISEAQKLFSITWKDESYKLANILAMYTGMRIGEIQALQIQDIGRDRIFVRHSWARIDGLKSPKNGTERQIKIPQFLRRLLIEQAKKSPYGYKKDNFIFYGYTQSIPCQGRHWNEALHENCKAIGIKDFKEVTFHSWRHFFTTFMADKVDERKLQLVTGHKTRAILEHYANHESEATLNELEKVASKLFLPILTDYKK